MSAMLFWINLGGKFSIEIFYKLNDFTFTVILMYHLACVQTIVWMDFDFVAMLFWDQSRQ